MRKINLIVIHSSATPPGRDIDVAEIRKWHLDRGWVDIGYHYVIRRNGRIQIGRPINLIGAHAKGHNRNSIGICMVGGVDDSLRSEDNFTSEQYDTLEVLINYLVNVYRVHLDKVVGHRDLKKSTECPSFDVKGFINDVWCQFVSGNYPERLVKERVSGAE